jgi:hypothetical protein
MKDPDFEEDVEMSEFFGLLILAIWIEVWSLGLILPSRVLVPNLITIITLEGGWSWQEG